MRRANNHAKKWHLQPKNAVFFAHWRRHMIQTGPEGTDPKLWPFFYARTQQHSGGRCDHSKSERETTNKPADWSFSAGWVTRRGKRLQPTRMCFQDSKSYYSKAASARARAGEEQEEARSTRMATTLLLCHHLISERNGKGTATVGTCELEKEGHLKLTSEGRRC